MDQRTSMVRYSKEMPLIKDTSRSIVLFFLIPKPRFKICIEKMNDGHIGTGLLKWRDLESKTYACYYHYY